MPFEKFRIRIHISFVYETQLLSYTKKIQLQRIRVGSFLLSTSVKPDLEEYIVNRVSSIVVVNKLLVNKRSQGNLYATCTLYPLCSHKKSLPLYPYITNGLFNFFMFNYLSLLHILRYIFYVMRNFNYKLCYLSRYFMPCNLCFPPFLP